MDVDEWLTRKYRQHRQRWAYLVLAVAPVIIGFWAVPLGSVLAARYYGLSLAEFWIVFGGAGVVGVSRCGMTRLLLWGSVFAVFEVADDGTGFDADGTVPVEG